MVQSSSTTALRSAAPVFLVADVASTIRWYRAHLGFDGDAVPEAPPHTFGILSRDGVQIMLQQLEGYQKPDLYGQRDGGVWSVYLRTEGVRALYETIENAGEVEVLEPLHRQPYGETEFVIRDLDGYTLVFAERE